MPTQRGMAGEADNSNQHPLTGSRGGGWPSQPPTTVDAILEQMDLKQADAEVPARSLKTPTHRSQLGGTDCLRARTAEQKRLLALFVSGDRAWRQDLQWALDTHADDANITELESVSMKRIKTAEKLLSKLSQLDEFAMRWTIASAILGVVSLGLAVTAAEMCRVGYVPTEDEQAQGAGDPYAGMSNCSPLDRQANLLTRSTTRPLTKVWFLDVTVLAASILLALCVVAKHYCQQRAGDFSALYIVFKTFVNPDLDMAHRRHRQRRWRLGLQQLLAELVLTVALFPLPGTRQTFYLRAMGRHSRYELEPLVVVLMVGRVWHVWEWLKTRLFNKHLVREARGLGHEHSITYLLRWRNELNNKLAIKLFFRRRPGATVCLLFLVVIAVAAYAIRAAEAPDNAYHSTYFWNQLWLVVVTASTVGYGDNVPVTHVGRFVCVAVMAVGAVLVAMMTAAATEFLNFSAHEETLCRHADAARRRRQLTDTCAAYMQVRYAHAHAGLVHAPRLSTATLVTGI